MSQTALRRLTAALTGVSILLPIAIAVLAGLGRLLRAMGDDGASRLLEILALLAGAAWLIGLIVLLLALSCQVASLFAACEEHPCAEHEHDEGD